MARRVREHDWEATSLGPIEAWPQRLKGLVDLILASHQAMYVVAGGDLVMIHNDAYDDLVHGRRPPVLGVPFRTAFKDQWPVLEPLVDRVMRGQPQVVTDQRFSMPWRPDQPEGWFTFSLTPLHDDEGETNGFLASTIETTGRVRMENALRESEARHAFLLRLSDSLRPLTNAIAIQETASRLLGEQLGVERAAYGEMLPDDEHMVVARDWTREGVASVVGTYRVTDSGAFFMQALRVGKLAVIEDALTDAGVSRENYERIWSVIDARAAIAHPIVKDGRLTAAFFIHSKLPRRWTPDEISLVTDVGERTWEAVERAHTEIALHDRVAWLAGQKDAFLAAINGAPLAQSLGFLVATALAQIGGDMRCAFYVANAEGTELRHVVGMPEPYALCVDGFRIASDSLACGLAVHNGNPVITADVVKEPRWGPWLWLAEQYAYRAVWSFPIETSTGKVVGTFAMYFGKPREATPLDHEFAAVITRAAAIIISRHREAQDRATAEAALGETEERLQQFADASLDVLWIRSAADLQWTFLSRGFDKIYGISRQDALAGDNFTSWMELILPEDRDVAMANIRNVIEGKRVAFEYRIRRPVDGQIRWLRNTDFPMRNANGEIDRIGGVGHDITPLKDAQEHQKFLLAELQHRVRNTLSVIRAIARRSAESSETAEELGMHLDGRIAAFARVQAAVTRDPTAGLDLEGLVADTLFAASAREGEQLSIAGPPVQLAAKAAETIGLALHELTTNALKYGALSVPDGHIAVRWTLDKAPDSDCAALSLEWVESGQTPSDTRPKRNGFGTELLTRSLAYDLNASVERQFGENGMRYAVRIPATSQIVKF
ncbi:GAF domain-containing protein [Mesorhizobium sp.]|uniref:GAF domain-containing protein n=1 Tax=Mesorhizobium sp. TaxID=1871066 RepID=UPI0025E4479E|nr:GAF domain-containing protein [Mesorhizobium sp.]